LLDFCATRVADTREYARARDVNGPQLENFNKAHGTCLLRVTTAWLLMMTLSRQVFGSVSMLVEITTSVMLMIYYSTVALVPPMFTMDVWRGIT